MISLHARLHEVICKRLSPTMVAHFATVTIDDAPERLCVRLSADEHARLDAAFVAKRKFVMTLSIAAPEPDGVA